MEAVVTPNSSAATRSISQLRLRAQTPPPQPTTPLRPASRSSLRSSHISTQGPFSPSATPLALLEPAFAELSDSMADLEANFMHMQLMHESLSRFSECFASFLYGMNVNAFCVDFPEAPVPESFRRALNDSSARQTLNNSKTQAFANDGTVDIDQTFLTTDTSFVENPPGPNVRSSASSRSSTVTGRGQSNATSGSRGIPTSNRSRGVAGRRGRGSGLARATNRAYNTR